MNVGEDIACMAPCVFHAQSIYIMEDCLYYYRQNPTSMTKNKNVFLWDGPEIRGRHLEKHMDMNYGNIQQQVYRSVTHALFTVVKSQFNRTDVVYDEIKKDINKQLDRSYYKTAINNCRFRGYKALMMKYSLKYRWFKLLRWSSM